ncbi:MAG: PrgI family protein [Candidatus Liptonbacteria bacterium]|nr:PrgI family protein [Candidatus Liptonbacteria bacterium]
MQFQVPQFIETEDKIVGPLSLRQFVYVGITAGFCFALFFIIKLWLWIILTIIIGGGGLALALVKVNGRPLTTIFLSALKFYWQPQTFVWQAENPEIKKEEEIEKIAKPGFSLEDIIMGLNLKGTWQKLQTGTKRGLIGAQQISQKVKERYQIFEKITGERQAARRVDYR